MIELQNTLLYSCILSKFVCVGESNNGKGRSRGPTGLAAGGAETAGAPPRLPPNMDMAPPAAPPPPPAASSSPPPPLIIASMPSAAEEWIHPGFLNRTEQNRTEQNNAHEVSIIRSN
jgi:hypothetical protein